MNLAEASQILRGTRPRGTNRVMRDATRDQAQEAFKSFITAKRSDHEATMRAAQWEQLASRSVAQAHLLPGHHLQSILNWIASAPAPYAGLALDAAFWHVTFYEEAVYVDRLLRGDAGPYARVAVVGQSALTREVGLSLLHLPQHELESVTSPNTAGWSRYADRLIACSGAWVDRRSEALFKALCRVASEDAAEWAIWCPWQYEMDGQIMSLLARLPPSPQMMEVVARFGKPEIMRELLAAQVGRQLCTEMPRQDDDALPQAEMI